MHGQTLHDELFKDLDDVERIIGQPSLADEHRTALETEMTEVAREVGRFHGTDALEGHLTEFLQVAKKGRLTDEREGRNDELARAVSLDTLCRCEYSTCAVKNGQLPSQLKTVASGRYSSSRDIERVLADYLREHPEAVALREGKRAWEEWGGELRDRVKRLHAAAIAARDYALTDDDEQGSPPELQL